MAKLRNIKFLAGICSVLFSAIVFLGLRTASAEVPIGKTYDQSNYQKIEDHLATPVLIEIKKGDVVITTGKLDFETKLPDEYIKISHRNEGNYGFAATGYLIDKATGEFPEDIRGNPFPTIDPKDPQAAQKIMENFQFTKYRESGRKACSSTKWVGDGGMEREVLSRGLYLYYYNRIREPIPNPSKFLFQSMTTIAEPYDLRGTASMAWAYTDDRENSAFNYLPMLRRVRRTSAAAGSDPFLGSDACTDDAYGYNGKNADMEFKYSGSNTILVPFVGSQKSFLPEMPDRSLERQFIEIKKAYQVPGAKAAKWWPINIIWVERPLYIVKMYPKDPYYNYGNQFLYIDTVTFFCYFKEVYDRPGEYWKNVMLIANYHEAKDGTNFVMGDNYTQIDDKKHHATVNDLIGYRDYKYVNLPEKKLGPQSFTQAAMIQLSK